MSKNIKEDLNFFNELVKELLEDEVNNPVSSVCPPENLTKRFDLSLNFEPAIEKDFREKLRDIVLNTPKSSSNLFFNQLFGGRQSKAVLGDLLSVLLNNSMATYKICGPQVGVEKEVLNKISQIIGYENHNYAGTFPTGGSMSNFMSLVMARDKMDVLSKNQGISKRLIAYTSENSHYSVSKNASFSGIGRDNVRYIACDKKGRIKEKSLILQVKEDIKNGLTPFYLNATAGTTVLGAFDAIKELSVICKKHNIWLHVDGAFGGTVIFSNKHKHLVEGIELSDSFCFNAHKTLGAPLSTSVLLVREKQYLYNSFDNEATYLYQTDGEDNNLGKTSFECGRRNNALKFWCLWKAIGTSGIQKIIDHEFFLADIARKYIYNNPHYTLYSFEDSLSVCFNYKNYDPISLCTELYKSSKLMVGYGIFNDTVFIRLVLVNSNNTEEDILNMFKVIEEFTSVNTNLKKTTS